MYDKESVGTLAIAIDRVGVLRVELYDQEHAAAVRAAFAAGATGRVQRAEPLPPLGRGRARSSGGAEREH